MRKLNVSLEIGNATDICNFNSIQLYWLTSHKKNSSLSFPNKELGQYATPLPKKC